MENRLTRTIGTTDMTASTTLLTGVTSGNIFSLTSVGFPFVLQKGLQLKEVPFVNLFSLLFAEPNILANPFQVLQNDGASLFQRAYNLFADAMVDILTKPSFFRRHSTQVSFARMPFGLQFATQPFVSSRYGLHLLSAEELIVRGDSKIYDSSINTDHFTIGRNVGDFLLKDDIQKDLPVSDKQIGGSISPAKVLLEVFRNQHLDSTATFNRLDGNLTRSKKKTVTIGVITDRATVRFWASRFSALFDFGSNCFQRLGGFHASRDCQLGRKIFSGDFVGLVVQRNAIGFFGVPTRLADEVVRLGVGIHRRLESLWRSLQDDFRCTNQLHICYFKKLIGDSCKKMQKVLFAEVYNNCNLLRTRGDWTAFLPEAKDIGVSCLPAI